MAKTAKKKSSVVKVDFTGVDLSGGASAFHIPEGDYKMKLEKAERSESKAGNDMIVFTFSGTESKAKGKRFYLYAPLEPADLLWKYGQILKALGEEVPDDDELEVDLADLVGREVIGSVLDEDYEGKARSKVQAVMSPDDAEEDEGDNKKSAAKKKAAPAKNGKAGKAKVVKLDGDEVKAMSEDELVDLVEEHNLEVDLDEHKTLRRKAGAVVEALEEADMLAA